MIGRCFGSFCRSIGFAGRSGRFQILPEDAVDLDAEAREEDRDNAGCCIEAGNEYRDNDPDALDGKPSGITEAHELRRPVTVFHAGDLLYRERHQEEIQEGDTASADTAQEYLIVERDLIRYDIM